MTENAPDPAAVLHRLRRLEDMEAARNHLHRYAETLDAPTPEAVAALFSEDGVLRTALGEFAGRAAIAGFYRDRLRADPSEKRHFIVSPRTTWIEPGVVEIASYFLFTARGDASAIGWGTYLDLLRVEGDTAWFTAKAIEVHMGTDLTRGWAGPGRPVTGTPGAPRS